MGWTGDDQRGGRRKGAKLRNAVCPYSGGNFHTSTVTKGGAARSEGTAFRTVEFDS